MAITEAAISSSINHPNVVQTYTYLLQPTARCAQGPGASCRVQPPASLDAQPAQKAVLHAHGQARSHRSVACCRSDAGSSANASSTDTTSAATEPASGAEQDLEVLLVLEFCELGSLKDLSLAGGLAMPGAIPP